MRILIHRRTPDPIHPVARALLALFALARALRYRYPEIDAISIGQHRLRRWRRKDLEALIAKKRKLDHHPGWRGETP